ncbi:hypothetical protein Y600_5847 [Burkholderia pseudomallei MSHR3709]|nr:hypothetical protein Y600_5847 [Burkholderia pseudomallei MSHR3709]
MLLQRGPLGVHPFDPLRGLVGPLAPSATSRNRTVSLRDHALCQRARIERAFPDRQVAAGASSTFVYGCFLSYGLMCLPKCEPIDSASRNAAKSSAVKFA